METRPVRRHPMSIRILTLALLLATPLVATPSAHAQAGEKLDKQQLNIARALFEEGLDFIDNREWTMAADRFSRVLQMRWSPVVAYNLGSALMEIGEIGSALEHIQRVLREPDLDEAVRKPAEQLLEQAEARMGKLRIDIRGETGEMSVIVDDSEWPKAAYGIAVPMAPGRHRVVLRHRNEDAEVREILITEREQLDVTFNRMPETATVPAPADVAAAAPRGEASEDDPLATTDYADRDDGGGDSILGAWWLWTGVGAVVLATVATVVIVSGSDGTTEASPIAGNFDPPVIEGKVQ